MSYFITYRYVYPSPAGPFKGKTKVADAAKKGDEIRAPFGRAIVTSCRAAERVGSGTRPSGEMCRACLHRDADCSALPFSTMSPMKRDRDGTLVVRCTNFAHRPAA